MLFPVGSLGVSCSKVRGAGIATVGRCLVALPLGSWVCGCSVASVLVEVRGVPMARGTGVRVVEGALAWASTGARGIGGGGAGGPTVVGLAGYS